MPSRSFNPVTTLVAFMLMLFGLLSGCKTNNPPAALDFAQDTAAISDDVPPPPPAISEAQAMQIAMTGLDASIFTATSTIMGPMTDDSGQAIEAYEVTVNGGDKLVLRYVNDATGELIADQDAWHDIPTETDSGTVMDTGAPPPPSYYTSGCPAGWPLCIKSPSTITFYSQNDPSWKSHTLGYGPSTIGSAGCLLSTYAMAICQNHHVCVNSDTLNTAGKSGGCFSGDLLTLSGGAHKCIAGVEGATDTKIDVSLVWSTLASGKAVIAYGYSSCMHSNHAQMIWGHDGSRYWTKDPWYDWTNQDQSLCVGTSTSSPTYYQVN